MSHALLVSLALPPMAGRATMRGLEATPRYVGMHTGGARLKNKRPGPRLPYGVGAPTRRRHAPRELVTTPRYEGMDVGEEARNMMNASI